MLELLDLVNLFVLILLSYPYFTGTRPSLCLPFSALRNLAASNAANKDAIREAGGITQLVSVLRGGPASLAALQAAAALRNLASNNTANQHAIRGVGGIGC